MATGSGFLGTPYRVIYDSKSCRSGLSDIIAAVIRPDSTTAVILNLTEIPRPGFQGCYAAFLNTTETDLEGEWVARVASPTEQVIQTLKITMRKPYDSESFQLIEYAVNSLNVMTAKEAIGKELVGYIDLCDEVVGYIDETNIIKSCRTNTTTIQKTVKNGTGAYIRPGSALTWNSDGTVGLADANTISMSRWAGIAPLAIPPGAYGSAIKQGNGLNILVEQNIITAGPGDFIYLDVEPGRLTLTPPNPAVYTILRVGVAEPRDGMASNIATDLYIEPILEGEPLSN